MLRPRPAGPSGTSATPVSITCSPALGLLLLVAGAELPGTLTGLASAVVAVVLAGVAVARHRPRGKKET